MLTPLFQLAEVQQDEFFAFWLRQYGDGKDEALYRDNIRKELTEERILKLFTWKNGYKLSQKKEESVQRNFIQRLGEINDLADEHDRERLLSRFPNGGVIFRIFWLHCVRPNLFPIYDQHVHRAMTFMQNGATKFIEDRKYEEIPTTVSAKVDAYLKRYVPFHDSFAASESVDGGRDRTVDKALWAFGEFLLTHPKFVEDAISTSNRLR